MQATHEVKVDVTPRELGKAIAKGSEQETREFWCSYAKNINPETISETARVMVKHGYSDCKVIKDMAKAINYHEMMEGK